MSDEIKHECAVAMIVARKPFLSALDMGGTKLSLLLEKQHNRGQDGAGAAVVAASPVPGSPPYRLFKSASQSPLADVLGQLARRERMDGRVFIGHLRYATFGKNELKYCHPFVHDSSDLGRTLLLAGNFNLTNAKELFDGYRRSGAFPTSMADGYLVTSLVAQGLERSLPLDAALAEALAGADGAWTLVGATGDGEAFAVRDPRGIRPGWFYADENVFVAASERPAIQAAFDIPPEEVKELPRGCAVVVSRDGSMRTVPLSRDMPPARPCAFERIYFSRANDADIHRERKALGAALVPRVLAAADAPPGDVFFSYIPNSARIAFHGLVERLFSVPGGPAPRFGEIAVKDAKFRTFIADAAARREFYKHVYDVTYGLVRPGKDVLVVLDDSIVRGNTMKNAILPMLDRLGPRRIVVASSAPPIRYPDCYGIDMSTLGELVAFKALVNLLGPGAEKGLADALEWASESGGSADPLAALYARFPQEAHEAEISRLLTPPGMKAEVRVVYQTVESLEACLSGGASEPGGASRPGDWYFTGDYPTPGGYGVLRRALENYLVHSAERSY